eukprot:CAMPEP_0181300056 /NCGR_PEP_ID=MMETSP1101-20121128/6680_1 /TAXON_ID=46948 /ORGANISM="Rhodomonas abbreviata, Strain Caron Lab Isolate" /LENGTH=697 /DNA_ID=CAMNT_0023405255 /DNA_START=52 /DNA_END=2145 /DNA_ORIENTATION=+
MGPLKTLNRVIHKIADKTMFWIVGDDSTYIYNVSWEDPRIDHTVLTTNGAPDYEDHDHVITIASAGCNAFDYLIKGSKVTAVDFNFAQIALSEIKARACMDLNFDEYFSIFAKNNMELFRQRYKEIIRGHCSEKTQKFWDKKLKKMTSIMYSGTSGWLAYLVCRVLMPVLGLKFIQKTVAVQNDHQAFQDECTKHKRRINVFCWLVDKLISNAGFALMAGVPSRQLELGLHRNDNFQTVFRRLLTTQMTEDNYFYYGYIAGEYTEQCCPLYLKREAYPKLKKALENNRLNLFHGTLVDVCKPEPPADLFHMGGITPETKFTIASLLDHMDWMPPSMINEEFHWLEQRMDLSRGRCFWRSFSEGVHSAPLVWLKPVKVNDETDRVAMYWSTWVAPFNGSIKHHLRTTNWSTTQTKPQTLYSQLMTGVRIVTFPFIKSWVARSVKAKHGEAMTEHGSKIEAFYQSQKDDYDAFRESFLHARPVLAECLPLKSQPGKMVWVDVGGGTARNLEFFSPKTLQEMFSKIVVVDISPSLLEVARSRVEKAGLSDIVECVCVDFIDANAIKDKLPKAGTVDIVTFSYSLSMIPDKAGALKSAVSLLKPKGEGVLGVADFFFGGGKRASHGLGDADGVTNILSRIYCEITRLWFKQDGVILLKRGMFDGVRDKLDFESVPDEHFRKRVPLLPILRPWHGVVMAPTK